MGPDDDITHFSYAKKTNKDQGPAIIGIEVSCKENFDALVRRMEEHGIIYEYLNDKKDLFEFLI